MFSPREKIIGHLGQCGCGQHRRAGFCAGRLQALSVALAEVVDPTLVEKGDRFFPVDIFVDVYDSFIFLI